LLTYETLDTIADAYTPALGGLWLLLVATALFARAWKAALMRLVLGVMFLAVAYGVMWLDGVTGAWPSVGLDYSTHTAVAFALVAVVGLASRLLVWPAIVSLLAYFVLMLYQQYHSVADIFSTLLVVSLPIAAIARGLASTVRLQRPSPQTAG
jgi:hypothetical protein